MAELKGEILDKTSLQNKFLNGSKPTEQDFADLIESCYGPAFWAADDKDRISLPNISTGPNVKVGIGTNNPEADLHVNGSLRLSKGTDAREIVSKFNETLATANAIPTVDAVIAFVLNVYDTIQLETKALKKEITGLKASSRQMILIAKMSTGISPMLKNDEAIPFQQIIFQHPNITGSPFDIQDSGYYRIHVKLFVDRAVVNPNTYLTLKLHAGPVGSIHTFIPGTAVNVLIEREEIVYITKGQGVYIMVQADNSGNYVTLLSNSGQENSITIEKLCSA